LSGRRVEVSSRFAVEVCQLTQDAAVRADCVNKYPKSHYSLLVGFDDNSITFSKHLLDPEALQVADVFLHASYVRIWVSNKACVLFDFSLLEIFGRDLVLITEADAATLLVEAIHSFVLRDEVGRVDIARETTTSSSILAVFTAKLRWKRVKLNWSDRRFAIQACSNGAILRNSPRDIAGGILKADGSWLGRSQKQDG